MPTDAGGRTVWLRRRVLRFGLRIGCNDLDIDKICVHGKAAISDGHVQELVKGPFQRSLIFVTQLIVVFLTHDDIDIGIPLIALGGCHFLEIVYDVFHHGVGDVQLAFIRPNCAGRGHKGIAGRIRIVGAVHLDIVGLTIFIRHFVDIIHLELCLGVCDRLVGLAIFLGQIEVDIHTVQLDGTVPGPLGILPAITGQDAIDIDCHHQTSPCCLFCTQTAI